MLRGKRRTGGEEIQRDEGKAGREIERERERERASDEAQGRKMLEGSLAIEEKTASLGWIRKLIRRDRRYRRMYFYLGVKRKWRESY